MKNVYFVQANNVYGDQQKNTYIPYAVGCIQAYCRQNPIIREHYAFGRIVYAREPAQQLIAKLKDPFAVLFSCSVWNTEYNKATAAAIKKAFPDCIIVFGGHSISPDGEFLRLYPYIDFLTHRFGEEPTEGILVSLAVGGDLADVPNISYRTAQGEVVTTAYVPQTGTEYPSPYLTGEFDDILEDDVCFSALFETNRGCPFSCAYCDWSALKSKVRCFPMERVLAEIDWFVAHKIEFIYCTDGNFCIFDRDEQIADYIIQSKHKYGYPKVFRVFFTKNRRDFVFRIGSDFVKNGLDKALTLSFQSMDPQVLVNIGRKNITTQMFRELMTMYNRMHITTGSELILGLPGETYDSFCAGVHTLLDIGQHFAINIYPCELLPNSTMGQKAYREKFGIRSTRVQFQLIHSNKNQKTDDITEYSEYVTSTDTMSEEDWERAMFFGDCIQGLHNLGLLRAVAIYCVMTFGTRYDDFYNRLIAYALDTPGTPLYRVFSRVSALCAGIVSGANAFVATCDATGDLLWGFDELIFLECYRELDAFYAQIRAFLFSAFGASEVLDALVEYQKAIIKKIGIKEAVIVSDYDFYDYFRHVFLNDPQPLEAKRTILTIRDPAPVDSFVQFARENVWYGRNRRETDYTSNHYTVKTSHEA